MPAYGGRTYAGGQPEALFFGLFPVQEKMSAGKKRLYVAKAVKIAKIEV